MRRRRKYKVKIYDEAHLEDRGEFSLSWWRVLPVVLAFAVIFIFIGVGIVWFTPVKKKLPGYMKTDQRARTEEAYTRVDSLEQLYTLHQAYLDNLLEVLNSNRDPETYDTTAVVLLSNSDTLKVASEIEKQFFKRMEEAGYITSIQPQNNDPEEQSDE